MAIKRIAELDGLRAYAVLSVIVYHMMHYGGAIGKGSPFIAELAVFLGATGVRVFFVISGFVITSLLLREKERAGDIGLKSFYIRRFFRIVPAFAVYLAFLALLVCWGEIVLSRSNWLWSTLFLGNYGFIDGRGWFVGHTWTLSVEEQFYIVYPILFSSVACLPPKRLIVVSAGIYTGSVLSPYLGQWLAEHAGRTWSALGALGAFRFIIPGVFCAFARSRVQFLLANKSPAIPGILLGCLLLSWFGAKYSQIASLFLCAFDPLACALFVLWFASNPAKSGFLRWKPVQWVGACSYSIYLWQQLFTAPPEFYRGWNPARSPLAMLLILACASLSYYLIELPGIRLGRRVADRFGTLSNRVASVAPVNLIER